jgi:hypothetical protein
VLGVIVWWKVIRLVSKGVSPGNLSVAADQEGKYSYGFPAFGHSSTKCGAIKVCIGFRSTDKLRPESEGIMADFALLHPTPTDAHRRC